MRSADLEAEALQTLARVLIDRGQVREGLAHFDEAMLFASEGRLSPYSTGKVYCSLISACEELGDLQRAAEWTEATAQWAREHPLAIFPGICRVHHASALIWRGQLALAAREADRACTELLGLHTPNAGAAYAEVGDIRRRLGDLDGAEQAFEQAAKLSGLDCPGLALLQLARGRVDTAMQTIDGCLAGTSSALARARVLPAHVQVAIAAGRLDLAQSSTDELTATADAFCTDLLRAAAATARGRLLFASAQPEAAAACLRQAFALWRLLDVPFEVATTGALLGRALRECGDHEAADGAFTCSAELFEQIGAHLDAQLTRTSQAGVRTPAGLTGREVQVLQLLAAGQPNRDIAAELVLSEKTVSRHLSNIFAKIGVSSRSAATAFAFEHRLVGKRSTRAGP
jgi:ATP/maltotriose-dependent transcriptional regulator MalT